MAELGYQADTGVVTWGTLISWVAERNPDLAWPNSIDVFDRMRREDPQVKSVLRAVTLPIMRTDWVIDGAGCRPEVVEHVARDLGLPIKGKPFVAPRRRKDRFSFKDFLRLSLLELVYGHSVFEQVYSIDDDGSTHLRKLAWRPPRTIAKFDVANDGGLNAIEQHGTVGGADIRIPVDRLVVFVNEREGANWVGESLLRAAYKMFVLKDRVLRIQALTAERNGLGLPVVTTAAPQESWDFAEATAWLDKQIEAAEEIAKDARSGDAAGVGLPNGASMQFVGVTGKLPDTDQFIRYYDEQIARAVLANFLNLGGNNSKGSYALSDVLGSFFTDSLNTIAEQVADIVDQHVIEDLVDLNYGPEEPAPRLVPGPIGERQQITAEVIKALVDCRALIVDEPLRAFVRDRWGIPIEDLTTADQTAEEAA